MFISYSVFLSRQFWCVNNSQPLFFSNSVFLSRQFWFVNNPQSLFISDSVFLSRQFWFVNISQPLFISDSADPFWCVFTRSSAQENIQIWWKNATNILTAKRAGIFKKIVWIFNRSDALKMIFLGPKWHHPWKNNKKFQLIFWFLVLVFSQDQIPGWAE